MTFADITITPVPHAKKEDYFEFSRRMAAVYRDHGATRIVDYWQADGAANQSDFHADGTSYSRASFGASPSSSASTLRRPSSSP